MYVRGNSFLLSVLIVEQSTFWIIVDLFNTRFVYELRLLFLRLANFDLLDFELCTLFGMVDSLSTLGYAWIFLKASSHIQNDKIALCWRCQLQYAISWVLNTLQPRYTYLHRLVQLNNQFTPKCATPSTHFSGNFFCDADEDFDEEDSHEYRHPAEGKLDHQEEQQHLVPV